jgi:hypothetical protein
MAWTTLLDTFLLSNLWQFAPASEAELYRFSFVTGDLGANGIGRYEVGQFDGNGSGYALKSYRTETFGLIIVCKKPNFFETQRLGLRVPSEFNPFTLKIEVNDMPYSSIGNPEAATAATSRDVNASTTAVVMATADPDTKVLVFENKSSKSLYLGYGIDPTATVSSDEVKANVKFEMPVAYAGEIKGIWATGATGFCRVTRFV